MAEERRRRQSYQTYGSLAYQERYDGNTVRVPRRREEERPAPQQRPRVQPRKRVHERPQVQVRQPGAVAPAAVAGFLAVALMAVLLVVSYAQLAVMNDQTVQLKNELDDLKTTEAILLAEYELAYDLSAIEAQLTADGSMIKLRADQITYLDISEPDSIIVYSDEGQGLSGIVERISSLLDRKGS